jgi:hypothetical protein
VEIEFANYQSLDVVKKERVDTTWVAIGKLKDAAGEPIFRNLAAVMLGILTIPHSNASCERIFSCVRKNKTDQRASMGIETLDALMVVKSHGLDPCREHTPETLRALKSAYYLSLKK